MSGTGTPYVSQHDGTENINNVELIVGSITRPFQIAPGYCSMFAYGTWDTATVKLQISPDKVKWFDFWSPTADAFQTDKRMGPFWGRWYVSSGGNSTAVKVFFTSQG